MQMESDNVAFGLILVWVGIAMASDVDNDVAGLNLMVIGGILVFGWLVRRLRGSRDSGLGIIGFVLAAIGLNQYFDEQGRDLPVAAIVVAAIGLAVIVSSIRPRKRARGSRHTT